MQPQPKKRSAQSGILFMLGGMMLVPFIDTLAKILSAGISPIEIAFWRFSGQVLLLGFLLLILRQSFKPGKLVLMALGGLTTALALAALVAALAVMPIATAVAIFFVEPLILTVLSALILKEKTGWRRFAAVGVGLLGAVIVIRPNLATFGPTALLPLVAAASFAVHAIVTRHVSKGLSVLTMQFWFSLFAFGFLGITLFAVVSLGFTPFRGFSISLHEWGLIAVAVVLATATFLLISAALKRSPASVIAPFQYTEIIGATVMGYLVFGDFPDALTWLGTSIILASGLYVFHRERQSGEAQREPGGVGE